MINKTIRCKEPKVNEYIEALEKELVSRDVSGIEQFIVSANKLSLKLSEEMQYLADGEENRCMILSNDKDDKLIDRILSLITKVDSFSKVSELAKALNEKYLVLETEQIAAPIGSVEDMIKIHTSKKKDKK